jgi:hypothetical protein
MDENGRKTLQPQVVQYTGLALVHEGESIYTGEVAAAGVAPMANVVNYYFPVEIEIVGAGNTDELAERIYAALQREFATLG